MNKKLIAGILFAVVAGASFWACGEGTVSKWNSDDDGLKFLVSADAEAEALKKEGLDSCLKDDYCKSKYAEYFANPNGDTPDDIPSSNDNGNSGTNPGQSSSSIGNHNPFDIVDGTSSSSAARIDDNPQGGDQSSSSVKEITGLGMCEPVTSPIEKNTGSTKWKFTANLNAGFKPADFARATFAWNFGAGATPATDATPSTSAPVSYANSGTATASVTVTIGESSETIQCEPLQVNGDPITGCECTTAAASVDYTATPDVTWSVTGCTSASMPLTYNWNGTDGGETFTNSFTAATASYAPTLKVGNSDNTVINVPCSAVKVTEGAEYTIKQDQMQGAIDLPAGTSAVVLEANGYNNTVFCNANGPINGTVNKVEISGEYYKAITLPAGTLVSGATLEFVLDAPAKCGIQ